MKKILLSITTLVLTLVALPAAAASSSGWWNLKPYVGVDAQERRMDYKGGFGDNIFKHNSPQGNVYAGVKVHKNLSVELGYEATRTRTRNATLTTGDESLGAPVTAAVSPSTFKSKIKLKGPHVDIVGFYTLSDRHPSLQLMGSVGVSVFNSTFERRTLHMGGFSTDTTRTIKKTKAVARLGAGLQHMINKHVGARLTINWVNTGRIVAHSKDDMTPSITAKPKNTTVYGLGILWVF